MNDTRGSPGEVFAAFLKLGLTSFGGPVAHLGYFRDEFVVRRRWFDERAYADLVALCQFLPGPASSQVGMAIGLSRAGGLGAVAAWVGFTLPSAVALVLFAEGMTGLGGSAAPWIHGLKVAAVAVVAVAVLGMVRSLTPDRGRASIAVAAAGAALFVPGTAGQIAAIAAGGLAGLLFLPAGTVDDRPALPLSIPKRAAVAALAVFFGLLVLLPAIARATGDPTLALVDAFYRTGALVFGGGHVVLPLLQAELVPRGFVDDRIFLAGYGAAQAVPGPLFTFAAYLGAVSSPGGPLGALLCLFAIFAPSMLLVVGVLPFWEALRRRPRTRSILHGVDAAVVGLLLAAFYRPVWTAGILNATDYAIGLAAFLSLFAWRLPPWSVVLLCALTGGLGISP